MFGRTSSNVHPQHPEQKLNRLFNRNSTKKVFQSDDPQYNLLIQSQVNTASNWKVEGAIFTNNKNVTEYNK